MGAVVEAEFRSEDDSVATVTESIRAFARASKEWELCEVESAAYAEAVGGEALIIEHIPATGHEGIAVALAASDDKRGTMRIYNVVPPSGRLSVDQYNSTVDEFVAGFRKYAMQQ